MMTLYTLSASRDAQQIESVLKELSAAYQKVVLDHPQNLPRHLKNRNLPLLEDGKRILTGLKNIEQYLADYKHTLNEWRQFQSDACYLDDEGEVC